MRFAMLVRSPISEVNDTGKFTLLADGTVTCLFADRTMLTLPFFEDMCTTVSRDGELEELILNR